MCKWNYLVAFLILCTVCKHGTQARGGKWRNGAGDFKSGPQNSSQVENSENTEVNSSGNIPPPIPESDSPVQSPESQPVEFPGSDSQDPPLLIPPNIQEIEARIDETFMSSSVLNSDGSFEFRLEKGRTVIRIHGTIKEVKGVPKISIDGSYKNSTLNLEFLGDEEYGFNVLMPAPIAPAALPPRVITSIVG